MISNADSIFYIYSRLGESFFLVLETCLFNIKGVQTYHNIKNIADKNPVGYKVPWTQLF